MMYLGLHQLSMIVLCTWDLTCGLSMVEFGQFLMVCLEPYQTPMMELFYETLIVISR